MTSQVFLPDPLLLGLCLTRGTRSQTQACLETLQAMPKPGDSEQLREEGVETQLFPRAGSQCTGAGSTGGTCP